MITWRLSWWDNSHYSPYLSTDKPFFKSDIDITNLAYRPCENLITTIYNLSVLRYFKSFISHMSLIMSMLYFLDRNCAEIHPHVSFLLIFILCLLGATSPLSHYVFYGLSHIHDLSTIYNSFLVVKQQLNRKLCSN